MVLKWIRSDKNWNQFGNFKQFDIIVNCSEGLPNASGTSVQDHFNCSLQLV